jgi:hypothetical protein
MTPRHPPWLRLGALAALSLLATIAVFSPAQAQAPAKKPNIIVIMGDDIGMWNIGAYHAETYRALRHADRGANQAFAAVA